MKNTELMKIVPLKQVGKKRFTPPTKSNAGIGNDMKLSGEKSNPTVTKPNASIANDKKVGGKKSNPTPTKSTAVTTTKATESKNSETKTTNMKTTELNVTKVKKSTAGSLTVKTPLKKRVTKNQYSTASCKMIKIDDAMSVNSFQSW